MKPVDDYGTADIRLPDVESLGVKESEALRDRVYENSIAFGVRVNKALLEAEAEAEAEEMYT